MNGGMTYPPGLADCHRRIDELLLKMGRPAAGLLNRWLPGKRLAKRLLVANSRTKQALPDGVCQDVHFLQENGVDLSLWARGSEHRRAPDQPFVVACIGRLIELKRVDIAIKSIGRLARDLPCRLLIVGDGPERMALEALAERVSRDVGASSDALIRFTGWMPQPDIAGLLETVDAVVMPSVRDCGGAAVLEAMAASLPVVATRWGGAADYLDERCGILVEPAREDSMVKGFYESLYRLAVDASLSAELGQRARRKVETDFDWERKCDVMLRHYLEVVSDS
jgi:glycosyltransferase involved in cell wall biosynthesis